MRRNRNKRCECKNPRIRYGARDVYCVKCGCNKPLPPELREITEQDIHDTVHSDNRNNKSNTLAGLYTQRSIIGSQLNSIPFTHGPSDENWDERQRLLNEMQEVESKITVIEEELRQIKI